MAEPSTYTTSAKRRAEEVPVTRPSRPRESPARAGAAAQAARSPSISHRCRASSSEFVRPSKPQAASTSSAKAKRSGIGYSNAPQLPEMVYGRAFFPLERAVGVVPGDKLTTHLTVKRVKGDFVYRWKSVVTGADGAKKAAFDQSTFKAPLISAAELRKVSGDYVPTLSEEGQVAKRVLQGMTGQQPLMEIAKDLSTQFPQRFRNAESALEVVARLSKAYS